MCYNHDGVLHVNEIMERVKSGRFIAIVRGLGGEHVLELAGALLAGGISMMEVVFDQSRPDSWAETCEAIKRVAKRYGDRMLPGAGTVMSVSQLEMACEAGAKYIISPDVNVEIIRATKKLGLISFPGAMTPTECVTAYNAGADAVKIFPAGRLGADYIKAIRAPLSHIPMLAVGGVSVKNAAEFIKAGCLGLGVGGMLVNREWVSNEEYEKITALAREYVKAVE